MDQNTLGVITLLFSYFVIALIFESAMSVVFNWRVFLERWNSKGLKTIILVVSACLLAFSLELNIFEKLLPLLGENYNTDSDGIIEITFTALFIAGGSSSIYEVLKKTATRNNTRNELVTKNSNLVSGMNDIIDDLLDITEETVSLKKNINVPPTDKTNLEIKLKNIRDILNKNS